MACSRSDKVDDVCVLLHSPGQKETNLHLTLGSRMLSPSAARREARLSRGGWERELAHERV